MRMAIMEIEAIAIVTKMKNGRVLQYLIVVNLVIIVIVACNIANDTIGS